MTEDLTRPLSLWQKFCLLLDQGRPGFTRSGSFTLSAAVRISGSFDHARLQTAFEEMVQRHEVLRSRIEETPTPRQVVTRRVDSVVEVVDMTEALSDDGQPAFVPVRYGARSPIRLRLASISRTDHLLTLHLHHTMADPATLWLALRELSRIYTAGSRGRELPAQYGDYARAEAAAVRDEAVANGLWWQQLLDGSQQRTLLTPSQDAAESIFSLRRPILPRTELEALDRWNRVNRSTTFATLLAGVACSIAPHYDSAGPLLFNTLFSRRDKPEWQRMLGPCTTPALMLVPRPPDNLNAQYVREVRDVVIGCYRHSRFPIDSAVTMTAAAGHESRTGDHTVPAVTHLPRTWPEDLEFGSAHGRVVASMGPPDQGLERSLGIRTRVDGNSDLVARVSWDGRGWSRDHAMQVCAQLRNHLAEL